MDAKIKGSPFPARETTAPAKAKIDPQIMDAHSRIDELEKHGADLEKRVANLERLVETLRGPRVRIGTMALPSGGLVTMRSEEHGK